MNIIKEIEWCIEQHRKTNHYYDEYLPYEFHLRMVAQVCEDFKHELPGMNQATYEVIVISCYGHDLIEDARVSYNQCRLMLGTTAADIVYALTNEKGKIRPERANEKYYKLIRETPYADYVKMCDRIANVRYSKLTKSKMFEMYKKENHDFLVSLRLLGRYDQMQTHLISLFND